MKPRKNRTKNQGYKHYTHQDLAIKPEPKMPNQGNVNSHDSQRKITKPISSTEISTINKEPILNKF